MTPRDSWWRRLFGRRRREGGFLRDRRRRSSGSGDGAEEPGRAGIHRGQEELDEEIRTHIELRADELVRQGMTRERARAEAERRFGDLDEARRRLQASSRRRDATLRAGSWRRGIVGRILAFVESVGSDLLVAGRHARQAPGFTLLAVAVFGLGVGLTTATYTVVDRVLIRSLPFPEPDEIVALYSVPEGGDPFPWVSQANWLDWKERSDTLEATAIHSQRPRPTTVAAGDDAFYVPAVQVSGPFFEILGNPVVHGRAFTEEEAQDEAPVALVSEGFWRRVLGADRELDRRLVVGGQEREIVGVVAAGREYPAGTDLWLPYRHRRQSGGLRNNINWQAIGRLRPGVGIEAARADLDAVAAWIDETDPGSLYSFGVGVLPLKDHAVGDTAGTLLLLMGAVASVLLVACANLAGLGYARGAARRHETAVRLALGAGRGRVVRQHVTEHVLLAVAGGVLGVVAAWQGTAVLLASGDVPLPRAGELGVDLRIFAAGIAVAVLSGLLAGVAPALRASSAAPRAAMGPGRGAVGGASLPGSILVGAEIALAVVLLVGGGLLVRSFGVLTGRDLGFVPEDVVTADVALSAPRYFGEESYERRLAYWHEATEAVRGLAGVEAVAVANPAPAGDGRRGFLEVEGQSRPNEGADYRVISDDYFELLQIPFVEGRPFGPADVTGGERVVIVNRAMARAHWPGESALGRRIRTTSMEAPMGSPWLRVVGVVENIRSYGFLEEEPDETMYVLHRQVPYWTGAMTLMARSEEGGIAGPIRERLRELDPMLAVEISTLDSRLGEGVSEQRLTTSVFGTFALLALLLAGIGVFGLQSFAVVQRRQEIAVRAALGAGGGDIVGMVLRNAARVVLTGAALGLVAAWWLADLMSSQLVEVGPRDPLTFGAVTLTLVGAALVATLVPALWAARLDPLEALRAD